MPTAEANAETLELCRRYRETGDRRLRNEIVERHMDLADVYVRRFAKRGVAPDDLRQVAFLATIRAVDRFDPDREVAFSTFASRAIEGELKRYFRDRTWSVRPPRRTQELHLELRRAQEDLVQQLGRAPTLDELADAVDESVERVLEALEAGQAHRADSVDQDDPHGDRRPSAAMSAALSADGGYGHVEERVVLAELIQRLPERQRAVLGMRFVEGLSQPEIAERVGVSQSYLSRMLRRALADLRAMAEDDDLLDAGSFGVAAHDDDLEGADRVG